MGFKLVPVITKTIPLHLSTDEDPDQTASVTIRQATQAEQEKRADLTATQTRKYVTDEESVEITQRWTLEEQMRLEVFLTLAGCDNMFDENDKPLWTFRMVGGKMVVDQSQEAFAARWGLLPSSVAKEIHRAVLEVNPQWDPKSR